MFFLEFFTPNLVPEYTIVQRSIEYRPHTEIPVREVEKYRYRYTGFEFGPVPITTFCSGIATDDDEADDEADDDDEADEAGQLHRLLLPSIQ